MQNQGVDTKFLPAAEDTAVIPPKLKKKQAGWRFPSEYVHWVHE